MPGGVTGGKWQKRVKNRGKITTEQPAWSKNAKKVPALAILVQNKPAKGPKMAVGDKWREI